MRSFVIAAAGAMLVAATARGAQWPAVTLTPVATNLEAPAHIAHAGDGSGRLFIVEQRGLIRILQDGAVLAQPFLNITNRVLYGGERGLLSVAFPPGFATNPYFYVNYTRTNGGPSIVSRFHVTATNANLADAASEERLLNVPQPFSNHNGGQLAFSPVDGYLYVGLGDGGDANDPQTNGQKTATLLGKILRLDVEPPNGTNYAVPAGNPFVGNAAYRPEIWALGLRNPWRFSFDRLTGDLYIADVGQSSWEEVNFQAAASPGGENYGWRIMEGAHCTGLDPCVTNGLATPVWEYSHALGCSVTGGEVYRGRVWSVMYGTYLYADYCTARVWGLRPEGGSWTNAQIFDAPFRIATFGSDEYGELYVSDYTNGHVLRVDEIYNDNDGDDLPDAWESYYGFSTNTPPGPGDDFDGDGSPDADEYRAGTDPTNRLSVLMLELPRAGDDGLPVFGWEGAPGRRYRLEKTESLFESFSILATNLANPSLWNEQADPGATAALFRAYRLAVEAAP
ncbi:MAG TPA: PQQ-dependent sugar dehydrogenase [Kiritimatiellia bacterium]|nr:PQQ-dependent sugar dehydrogenase [Kiritimatiellia bacterium]HSA19125.1 PQQ-dependent sugar dehydrogenase [Kiritimatiellia bacterium]